jgi:hypothetical protein
MSKELTVQQPTPVTALRVLNADSNLELVQAAIAENVGAGGITEFDFDRIKIPAGGGLSFNVTTLEGEDSEKTITGVIVLARDARAFWQKSLDEGGGNQPPDCHSNDGITGIANPGVNAGGDCTKCPLAQFGSDTKVVNGATVQGRGQACKAIRQLFILRGDSLLPVVLALPPTSLKAAKQYMLRLAGQGVPYWAAITKIGLENAQNGGGIKYSKATFAFAGLLNEEQKAKAKLYSDMLKPLVVRMVVDVTDYSEEK